MLLSIEVCCGLCVRLLVVAAEGSVTGQNRTICGSHLNHVYTACKQTNLCMIELKFNKALLPPFE